MKHAEYQQRIKNHLRSAYLLSDTKIEEVLPRFMASLESLMNDLEKVFDSGDIAALRRAGHAMKGAFLNLGLLELADIAFAIEKYDTLESKEADVPKRIAELKEALGKIICPTQQT